MRNCAVSLHHLVRIVFVAALVFATVMALSPNPVSVGTGDKFQHMLAFGTLTILAVAGWPGTPLLRIGERMSFLGAMIEVTQSIPALHRDCDILDWAADTAAVAGVLVVAWAWRRARARRKSMQVNAG